MNEIEDLEKLIRELVESADYVLAYLPPQKSEHRKLYAQEIPTKYLLLLDAICTKAKEMGYE